LQQERDEQAFIDNKYQELSARIDNTTSHLLVAGDWNAVHTPHNNRVKQGQYTTKYTPERAIFNAFDADGLIDTLQAIHPQNNLLSYTKADSKGIYRGGLIDAIYVSMGLSHLVMQATVGSQIPGFALSRLISHSHVPCKDPRATPKIILQDACPIAFPHTYTHAHARNIFPKVDADDERRDG